MVINTLIIISIAFFSILDIYHFLKSKSDLDLYLINEGGSCQGHILYTMTGNRCCGCWTGLIRSIPGSGSLRRSHRQYRRAKYNEKEYSIEFENLIEEHDFYAPPTHAVNNTERDILSNGKYNELVVQDRKMAQLSEEELRRQEENLRLEDEAYYQAKREAAKVARQNVKKQQHNSQKVPSSTEVQFSDWLTQDKVGVTSPVLDVEDFDSFLEKVKSKSLQSSVKVHDTSEKFWDQTFDESLHAAKIADDALNALQPVDLHPVNSIRPVDLYAVSAVPSVDIQNSSSGQSVDLHVADSVQPRSVFSPNEVTTKALISTVPTLTATPAMASSVASSAQPPQNVIESEPASTVEKKEVAVDDFSAFVDKEIDSDSDEELLVDLPGPDYMKKEISTSMQTVETIKDSAADEDDTSLLVDTSILEDTDTLTTFGVEEIPANTLTTQEIDKIPGNTLAIGLEETATEPDSIPLPGVAINEEILGAPIVSLSKTERTFNSLVSIDASPVDDNNIMLGEDSGLDLKPKQLILPVDSQESEEMVSIPVISPAVTSFSTGDPISSFKMLPVEKKEEDQSNVVEDDDDDSDDELLEAANEIINHHRSMDSMDDLDLDNTDNDNFNFDINHDNIKIDDVEQIKDKLTLDNPNNIDVSQDSLNNDNDDDDEFDDFVDDSTNKFDDFEDDFVSANNTDNNFDDLI